MRSADACLEHSATPDRDCALFCNVVNGDGLAEAADATDLNVDDAAGLHGDGG